MLACVEYLDYIAADRDFATELAASRNPVWVVHAEKGDGGLTDAERATLQAAPNVTLVTIPGSVFLLPDEAPQKTAEVIASALSHVTVPSRHGGDSSTAAPQRTELGIRGPAGRRRIPPDPSQPYPLAAIWLSTRQRSKHSSTPSTDDVSTSSTKRQQLTAERQPVTRLGVIQRAFELLHTAPFDDAPGKQPVGVSFTTEVGHTDPAERVWSPR